MLERKAGGDTYGAAVEIGLSLLLGAAVVFGLIQASNWQSGAKLFPQIVGAIFLGALVIRLVQRFRESGRSTDEIMDVTDDDDDFTQDQYWKYGLLAWLWVAGYIAAAALIGLGLASAAFLFIYLVLVGRMKWWIAALSGVAVGVLLIEVFNGMVGIQFPPAMLLG